MNNIKKVYILGNHIQALGLSRMAADLDLQVSLFNESKISVARFSNSCHRFVVFSNLNELLDLLLNEDSEPSTLLLATNDKMIGFMAQHYHQLSSKYILSIPDPGIIEICHNKRLTYQKAKHLGIPIPESYFPNTIEELSRLESKIRFPVILKPAVMYRFHDETGKKVFLCKDFSELVSNYQLMRKIIPAEEVIVQEYISGGATSLYSFGSFFANGEIYGGFIANRIRQNPMDFGVSTTFAKTVLIPEIEKLSSKFLTDIDYFGLSEVEFMYDEDINGYKLLEINPRAWKWHSISNKLDIKLLEMLVHYLEHKPISKKINDKLDIAWIEEITDTYVSIKEMINRRLSVSDYIKSMRLTKEFATWSSRDPLPLLMYIIMLPILYFKRS